LRFETSEGAALPPVLDPNDSHAAVRSALRGWLALQRAHALRPQVALAALAGHGDPVRALRSHPPAKAVPFDPTRDCAALARAGAVALPLGSSAYPSQLAALSDPAPLLCVRGDVDVLSRRSVAIVGSRAATVYGKRIARDWAAAFASAGLVVVSGLARGIDAEAHRGALDAGGTTVAVLACGIDRVYPREHRRLAEQVAASGAVIAELPIATAPLPPFFPMRNRLISGLAGALLVVEARLRSGSLTTAAHAANQGRDVFAVPGPIFAPTSEGPNQLLRDGAAVALGPGDVLGDLNWMPAPNGSRSALSGDATAVLAALVDEAGTRDELAARLPLTAAQLAVALLELELASRVCEDRDGRVRVVDLPE
jgi:DNA processing protein